MAITGSLQLEGSSGNITYNEPVNVTVTLYNSGASVVNVTAFYPALTSNGLPYSGAIVGTPTTPGNVKAIQPAGGSLTYDFSVIFETPAGSAETGSASSGASTTAVTLTVEAITDDGSATVVSQVITPVQLGAAAPAAAGQFLFASPLNSANIYLW